MKTFSTFFLISCCLLFVFVFTGCTNFQCNPQRAQRWFDTSQKDFEIVASFMSSYEHPDILIDTTDGTMLLLLNEQVPENQRVSIGDSGVEEAVRRLLAKGCKSIYKAQEDNAIVFLRWTRFNDFGAGVVFSLSDVEKPVVQYMTKIEELSQHRWYYYEEDYNEWRVRNTVDSSAR